VSFVRRHVLSVWALLALAYLFLPIFIIVLFSFNEPPGSKNYEWGHFSLNAWRHPFEDENMKNAFILSVKVAVVAVVISVILGTAMALALVKYRFKGKGIVNTILVLPLTMPEVVLGFSLLTLFVTANVSTGFLTIVIAHVMFCVSYVATTVKARIRGFNWSLEEAAADLGSTPWRTFRKVTLPLIAPGVFAAALLTFALSLDDFIITYLNSGNEPTFPIYVWQSQRSRIPPQINVFGTLVLVVSAMLAGTALMLQRRRERRAGLV
jgi:spermidine/putrescine transport system permease protein